jgi:hypothetical protein
MCVYLTVAFLAAHLLCQMAIAMWAVREARRAGFGDECDNCGPILPYITAAARGLVLCEPAYQSLCAYAPVAGMGAKEQELYTRHAQKVRLVAAYPVMLNQRGAWHYGTFLSAQVLTVWVSVASAWWHATDVWV